MVRIRNTYGFFTATMVTRTRHIVTLYVHCRSCPSYHYPFNKQKVKISIRCFTITILCNSHLLLPLLCPNIFLSYILSNNLSPSSLLNVKDRVSNPYKAKDKFIVSQSLIFNFCTAYYTYKTQYSEMKSGTRSSNSKR